jgi:hypothetical protein
MSVRRDTASAVIARRDRAFAEQVERYSAARRAISRGVPEAEVCRLYRLSATVYSRLAGQAKAGAR